MRSKRDEDFTAFAAAVTPALMRSAYLLSLDRALADDLVQTALAKMYVAWPRLVRTTDLTAYAKRVVVRAFLDEKRRPWRREHVTEVLPERAADPYAGVDERDRLRRAVATLPARQRAVVVMRVWDDLSVADTAAALGITEGGVKSQLSRALDSLRATMTMEAER